MDRKLAVKKLSKLVGSDLLSLARTYKVSVTGPSGKVNKGWAGHTLERYLGLPLNSSQAPNFGSWELKVVPLKKLNSGQLVVKETMAVTMIDPVHLRVTPFEKSHLRTKLLRAVIVARIVGADVTRPSLIHSICVFDLSDETYRIVKRDYEEIRKCVSDKRRGFSHLSGAMGTYIQPRTKGSGHGSTSRAFYARKVFVAKALGLSVET